MPSRIAKRLKRLISEEIEIRLLQHRVRETRSPGCPETDETLFRYFGAAAGLELATTKAESSVLVHYTTGRTPPSFTPYWKGSHPISFPSDVAYLWASKARGS